MQMLYNMWLRTRHERFFLEKPESCRFDIIALADSKVESSKFNTQSIKIFHDSFNLSVILYFQRFTVNKFNCPCFPISKPSKYYFKNFTYHVKNLLKKTLLRNVLSFDFTLDFIIKYID